MCTLRQVFYVRILAWMIFAPSVHGVVHHTQGVGVEWNDNDGAWEAEAEASFPFKPL